MNSSWLTLSIYSNQKNQNIISSYFDCYSIGNQYSEDHIIMYFYQNDKKQINDILLNINQQYEIDYKWGNLHSENWMHNWREFFKPLKINNQVMIVPDWDQEQYNINHVIRICPAMAFGTGHHASTQLVIEQMIQYDVSQYDSLLDLGSGSGILSILAKKMGVSDIMAIDIDPVCQDNFYKNCQLSNVSKIGFHVSDIHNYNNYSYDVILANIDKKNVLKILKKYEFSDSTAILILSGFLDTDINDIKSSMKKSYIDNKKQKDEWISLVIKKKDSL